MKRMVILFFLAAVFTRCDKGPPLPIEPAIEIVSVSPTQVNEFDETIVVELAYTDGDGNLGFTHPDSNSIRVWDDRLNEPDWYHLQPLAPSGSEISIQGTLNINLNGLFVIGPGSSDKTRFAIKIKDRSGNWSNEVRTPEITITK